MSDNDYCYDGQLSSIEGWLCTISGSIEEMKNLMKDGIIEARFPMPKKEKSMSILRMDYIDSFRDGTIESMEETRGKFIELEKFLRELISDVNYDMSNEEDIIRVQDEMFSHLEKAQMYATKYLCLIGEIKQTKVEG